jgi:tetratricopeptide (TPR) repeat protein
VGLRRRSAALVSATLAFALIVAHAFAQQHDRPATRARMQTIFNALSTALNMTLYETPFESSEDRKMIMDALGVLADNAAALETHGEELNESFDYLRRSLARDANEAVIRYRQVQYDGARFLLEQLLSNCVACHSKLPSRGEFDLGRAFVERARMEELSDDQRARLLVATRQFDQALEVYEHYFRSKDTAPEQVGVGDALGTYLKVAIGVVEEPGRARRTLESFGRRNDVTGELESHVAEWIRVIGEVDLEGARGAEMAAARRLVQEARQRNAFPGDRHGLAHFVIAFTLLQRYLESRPSTPDDVTEAYYLLGVCESHTTRSIWVSETEFYLESAVRSNPGSPYARLSLEFLEGYVTSQYRGSAGVMVPEEVRDRLDELRDLVDSAKP